MKNLESFQRALAIAGFVAMAVAGCGNTTPEALIDSAKTFSAKGDYKAAAIQLRNVLQKQPENGQARYLLGRTLNEQTDYVTAEKELRKALEYGNTSDGVYAALAQAMLAQGKGKDVVAEFGARTLADPEAQASLRTTLGLAYVGLGQRDAAGRAFQAALVAKPDYHRARVGQALLVASDRDIAGAMKIVDEVLAAAPTLPDAWQLKSELLLAQNDLAGAIAGIEHVVAAQPSNFQARAALATLRIRERKLDEAATEIAALKKAYPKDPRVSYLEALLAFHSGDPAKTRDFIQDVLKVAPEHAPSLLLAGAADFQLRSYDSAADRLNRVLRQYPQSIEAQVLLVSIYIQSGQPEKARDLLESALRTAPDNPKVLALAGAVALATNELAKASEYYERAAALDKDSASARTRLGQVRLAMGDADRAMKDLEAASALDATGYEADLALVAAHLRRNEFDKALDAAGLLEKKQPNNPLTQNVKGIVYLAQGDLKAARTSFSKALELQFDFIPAALNLARLDIAQKNPAAARARFEAIIAKQPKNDEAMIGLADVQAATGASPKAVVATLERAVAANPSSISAKVALANSQMRAGDAKNAVTVLQGAAAANTSDARVLELLGVAQQAAGNTNQAIATFQKLATLRPTAVEPLVRLAAAHYAAKDYEASIQALRKALVLKPGSLDVRGEIVRVRIAAGQIKDALAETRVIEKESPREGIGFVLEGGVYAAQKQWEPAAAAYREAMKRQPTADTVKRLYAVLQNQGKAAEANTLAANWIRDNPKDTLLRLYLAERALQEKNFTEAARLYGQILPLQPENPMILNNLAWTAMETKDPDALAYAEKAFSVAPENPSILDTYGWLLLQNGDAKRAVELLTAAVARGPDQPDIRLHLAKALIEGNNKAAARKEVEALLKLDAGVPQRAEAEELLKGL